MDWRGAIKPAREGAALDVEVVPGSRESRFPAGYNAWRGRLEAKVRAPPEGGQANDELRRLVADALGVPASRVRVASGHTSRRKTLLVEGLGADRVTALLAGRMSGGPSEKGFN